ncbi:MAG: metallophosphoesterase [Phycisphaerae bacterium]|nr:metallophosphoesterase [Phycisphaerae bacterium]
MRAVGIALRLAAIACVLAAIAFEGYTLAVHSEGADFLPPLFGNFPANRAVLEHSPPKDEFTFAVVGDTKSVGTFQRIVDQLRHIPLDFVVLLGDVADRPTRTAHQFLRAELAHEYALSCPVFFVVGNHDVGLEEFRMDDFERDYGPSAFSFRYQDCLFVILCAADLPSDEKSYVLLRQLANAPRADARHVFVFLHMPPVLVTSAAGAVAAKTSLVPLLQQIGADYVIAGHVHGYQRIALGPITYLVTGGGGSRLAHLDVPQIHHAMVIRVGKDFVQEEIVPVEPEHEWSDVLERFAIVSLGPWLTGHPAWAILASALALLVLLFLLRSLWRFSRPKSNRQPA